MNAMANQSCSDEFFVHCRRSLTEFRGMFKLKRFATVSGLNDMFTGNGVQRGLRYVFSCLVGVSEMSAQSAATCI